MKLPWFGPPKWKHADAAVRLAAVRELRDQSALAEVAEADGVREVRLAAVERLSDSARLVQVAVSDSDVSVDAVAKLAAQPDLERVARTAASVDARCRAVARIESRPILQRIAGEDTDAAVRRQARARLAVGNPLRELLKLALSRLPVAGPAEPAGAKVCGSVDGVCDTLVGDNRFRVHGIVGQVGEAATATATAVSESADPKIEAVVSGATVLELLGNTSPDGAAGTNHFNLATYYHIAIRRTGDNDFQLQVTERESRPPFRGGSNPPR